MKRQLEISTFVSHPAKKLKMSVTYDDAELSGAHDKITLEVKPTRPTIEDEDATSLHSCRPIIAGASGRLYYQKTKREIPQHKINSGYMMVNVPKPFGEKGRDKLLVHRAVWESFHGEIPANMESDHINDDPTDNRLCNLQLLTPSENCKKAVRRPGWISGWHRPIVPVVATCLDDCYQKEFSSMNQAARALGVKSMCVSLIIAGKQQTTKAKDGRRYTFHKA